MLLIRARFNRELFIKQEKLEVMTRISSLSLITANGEFVGELHRWRCK